MKYSLENGNVDLTEVTNRIKCSTSHCGNILILTNNDVFLLKNPATIVDLPNNKLVMKCTKCKTFNTINISAVNTKEVKSLLTV